MSIAPTLTAPPVPSGSSHVNILSAASGEVKVKVSSGNSIEGKNVLDGSTETCWTSDNLPPNSDPSSAHYTLSFKLAAPVKLDRLHSISVTFAGGFSPISLTLLGSQDGKTWQDVGKDGVEVWVKDANAKQYFDLHNAVKGEEGREVRWLRFDMKGSADDYGRVTIYQVEIFALQS
ncbi:hypothetical protein NDA18_004095 [Ustilago nuda]|uniref:Related to TR4 orphan receptor associated protein TRA16 n=1 Tax=Ustilago hordei TaxID=120017 RepID=I2FNM4_USTHO|nr:uncharacterized protein UHO2_07191 [Ustilago hordei]KAJ1025759.1 hypothetical protein NDA18_004095 [Ustilago nuda]KAJ1039628.1 hypothetical protein NDA10_006771 [Ustilago hordei]KAJ1570256.1 hypothetical protein NDA12_006417 [Ustilago hordei]KAJ1572125.1 hypothetical protein NDA15_005447 [Ustilago hordei]KAJ1574242.1 hypothetical protein NDA11_001133 [Ustilago hordei]